MVSYIFNTYTRIITIFNLVYQPKVLMHTIDKVIIISLFYITDCYNRTMAIKEQEMLQVQRRKKLRRQELKKEVRYSNGGKETY